MCSPLHISYFVFGSANYFQRFDCSAFISHSSSLVSPARSRDAEGGASPAACAIQQVASYCTCPNRQPTTLEARVWPLEWNAEEKQELRTRVLSCYILLRIVYRGQLTWHSSQASDHSARRLPVSHTALSVAVSPRCQNLLWSKNVAPHNRSSPGENDSSAVETGQPHLHQTFLRSAARFEDHSH